MVGERCPKCGGNLFVSNDETWHLECLQCSYSTDLPVNSPLIPSGVKPHTAITQSSAFNVHYSVRPSKEIKYQERG